MNIRYSCNQMMMAMMADMEAMMMPASGQGIVQFGAASQRERM